jgi:hypothetical protein
MINFLYSTLFLHETFVSDLSLICYLTGCSWSTIHLYALPLQLLIIALICDFVKLLAMARTSFKKFQEIIKMTRLKENADIRENKLSKGKGGKTGGSGSGSEAPQCKASIADINAKWRITGGRVSGTCSGPWRVA